MASYFSFKEELLNKINNVLSKYAAGVSRFALVYDFGNLDFFPIYLAVLTKKQEENYRNKMVSDSDFQLLWSPEEFTEYATKDLSINLSAEAEDFIKNIIESQDDYEVSIREAICSVCFSINDGLVSSFIYAVDPELADLKANIGLIKNIPRKEAVELPSWA
ncbi:hypothetical protein [Pseudomonas mangiferae]|uniref:DUF4303 domain-containing protein n=1 Tax=Pseudomonas mangiferae TaxID=2593654 RepID=A0A553GZ42_9PSED|nr:hypothetical protein [Pseudomonas mangiferae]TRX74775.1 hypothetical protein FM069_09555 [Pseudomonas mangiferae]